MDLKTIRASRLKIQGQFAQAQAGQAVEVIHTPPEELRDREQSLGKLKSPATRAFYSLHKELVDLSKALGQVVLAGKVGSLERLDATVDRDREHVMLHQLADAINSLFWLGMMDEYPQTADKSSMAGIRADWDVAVDANTCNCPICVMGRKLSTSEGDERDVLSQLLATELGLGDASPFGEDLPPEIAALLGELGGSFGGGVHVIRVGIRRGDGEG